MEVFGIDGKTALVTGSTSGIGYAIALALSRAGCVVFVNGRKGPSVEAAIGRLKSANPSGEFREAPGDLANAEGAKQVFDACARCVSFCR